MGLMPTVANSFNLRLHADARDRCHQAPPRKLAADLGHTIRQPARAVDHHQRRKGHGDGSSGGHGPPASLRAPVRTSTTANTITGSSIATRISLTTVATSPVYTTTIATGCQASSAICPTVIRSPSSATPSRSTLRPVNAMPAAQGSWPDRKFSPCPAAARTALLARRSVPTERWPPRRPPRRPVPQGRGCDLVSTAGEAAAADPAWPAFRDIETVLGKQIAKTYGICRGLGVSNRSSNANGTLPSSRPRTGCTPSRRFWSPHSGEQHAGSTLASLAASRGGAHRPSGGRAGAAMLSVTALGGNALLKREAQKTLSEPH